MTKKLNEKKHKTKKPQNCKTKSTVLNLIFSPIMVNTYLAVFIPFRMFIRNSLYKRKVVLLEVFKKCFNRTLSLYVTGFLLKQFTGGQF